MSNFLDRFYKVVVVAAITIPFIAISFGIISLGFHLLSPFRFCALISSIFGLFLINLSAVLFALKVNFDKNLSLLLIGIGWNSVSMISLVSFIP